MNDKNQELMKIGLHIIKNCDDFFAIQKLVASCHERIAEISKEMSKSIQIGSCAKEIRNYLKNDKDSVAIMEAINYKPEY